MAQLDLALVGYEPAGSENLSLRLLAGAVADSGYSVELFMATDLGESRTVAEDAARARPGAIGFTASDTENALHSLALAQLVRREGYRGYVVCGGPFATLQPDWILERAAAVDGVIRFDGEVPLVELLRARREGGREDRVPSLTTRAFSNPPLPSAGAPRWRPLRGELPRVMGLPTAMVIGGRGCTHRCDYCTHAAQASLVVRECREAGVPAEELQRSGLGRPRRRPLADLVGEMAELYHDRGVRYFQFIDENLVPGDEPRALALAAELRQLFDEHKIGQVALSFMTRGDALTEPVVDALVDLGLVRSLVGVESGSDGSLASLGRSGDAARGRRGLRLLVERGVVAIFNSMLLHPDCTTDTIRTELAFLSSIGGAQFETIQVKPLPRTRLHRRLAEQQRLNGGRLLPDCAFEDPAVARFQGLLARLQARVFGRYTPSFKAHDLMLSAALAERFGRGSRPRAVLARLREITEQINRARIEVLGELVDLCEGDRPGDLAIQRAALRFGRLRSELDRCEEELRSGHGLRVSRQYRNLAAAAAFVFALAGASACHRVDPPEELAQAEDDDEQAEVDTDVDSTAEDGSDGETDSDDDTAIDDEECDDEEYWSEFGALEELVLESCDYWEHEPEVKVVIDGDGSVSDIAIEGGWGEDEGWEPELRQCYLDLLEGEEFPCLAGEEIWISGFVGGLE